MAKKYHKDDELAKRIYRTKNKTMPLVEALGLCDKFLSSWLEILAPRFRWFETGDFELYIEPVSRGDFAARIHARRP